MEDTSGGGRLWALRSRATQAKAWFVRSADPWAKWMQVVAILGAGFWALYNFNLLGTSEPTPLMKVAIEVLPYDEGKQLLVVHVKPSNLGKTPINLRLPISVAVRRIPDGAQSGHIDREKLPVVFEAKNIIQGYGGYQLDPGVEFDEVEPFLVPVGAAYVVEAVLNLDKDTEVAAAQIVRVDAAEMPNHAQNRAK
ncbi:hypothetical protein K6V72_24150 [Ralstonia insidiosa]|uniref:Uncharacterized protein n=1 Tax=Ralstonia insidiosa TaxID=190721 RepID=A0A191ZZE1_9RALS|nr:hypothetical protein [Ralstonia insidiosa]ANJ73560.1 hypothetical protein A9Y76_14265 [Ralstonia insidiosa]KAB0473939.1 hypothetical protein F7R11_15835 [Ralstonia insidiosa]MBY4912111.1 hypothetical protein [Ralstonia insidiosa]